MVQSVGGQHELWIRLFAGRSEISLTETGIDDTDRMVRIVDVHLDGDLLGEIRLWTFQYLGLMVEADIVAMWTGVRFYWVDLQNKSLHECDQNEEVQSVYAIGSALLLVREISVALFNPETSTIVDETPFSDVNWGWEWEGSRLVVNDFQERQFEISVDGWQLVVRER